MSDSLAEARENLIREVRYRASYRGTLELDLVCRPLLAVLDGLDDDDLLAVRNLLLEKEGDLMSWLVEGQQAPAGWREPVGLIRSLFEKNRMAAG